MINLIPKTLRNTDQPVRRYILKAWLIALLPSLVIAMVLGFLAPDQGPAERIQKQPLAVFIIGALTFSPWVETLLMWPILAVLKRRLVRPTAVVLGSAAVWAVFHSLLAPTWGIAIFWPFVVFSVSFLEWEKKSRLKAIGITALIHTCQNLVPALVLLLAA